jgi:NOL1/NOP2/fmu family ribosome biogenesis protein
MQRAPKEEINLASNWIKKDAELFFFKQTENIIAIPSQWKNDIALLQKKLYLRKAGVTIGAIKGKDLIPDHEFALSLLLNKDVQKINLNYDEAIGYLKKKDLQFENAPKGWTIVNYCGLHLGWIKVLHNRINNYYPTNWRILKD